MLMFTACATVNTGGLPRPSPESQASAWQARQAALAALPGWTLAGRIAVSNDDTNWSAALHWIQQADRYTVEVIAPLGQGAARLDGGHDGVALQLADGRLLTATDPELLLQQHTGLHMPVTGLRFWVMGMPNPASEARQALDDAGRLAWLEQAGWRIEFLRYSQVSGLDLPAKLVAINPRLRMRLVIDRWELPP